MEEKAIIIGCKRNDRHSQRAFVDQYSSYLFGICLRYVKSDFDAKDCLQDSLILILNKIDLYDDNQGYFKGWITKITTNQCLSYLRKYNRIKLIDIEETEEFQTDEVVTKQLELEDVLKLLKQIPDKYRIAINMYVIEGFTHQEIGDMLGINESSSRSLVSRVRKFLIEKYRDYKSSTIDSEKIIVIDIQDCINVKTS